MVQASVTQTVARRTVALIGLMQIHISDDVFSMNDIVRSSGKNI